VLRELVDRAARGDLDDARWRSVVTDLEHLRQPADGCLSARVVLVPALTQATSAGTSQAHGSA